MSTELVQAWADIWNGDLSLIESTVAEDFVSHAAPVLGGPAQDSTGRHHLDTWISGIRWAVPDLMFTVQVGPIVDDPFIVVRWHARGTYQGGLPGTPDDAAGRRIAFYGTDILRVSGGLITEYWVNADSLWFAQQLGIQEVPALVSQPFKAA
jgi:predicted ester cyclase